MAFDIHQIRQHFPALSLTDRGIPRIYLDNPAGTQVPRQVIERMNDYMVCSNANHGGYFRTSEESNKLSTEAHQAMADFLNASSAQEIVFGPNMTSLTYAISRSLAHWFKPGDSIIVTRMDHDANIAPWLQLAKERALEIRWLNFNRETYQFNLQELEQLLSPEVKLLAIAYASNAIGTINPIKKITEMAHASGTLIYVDAVQYAPHYPIDVQELDCDFLVSSAYKFFGSHQGILWGKGELLEQLPAYQVRPASPHSPGKFETGTQSYEGQAGILGALEYLAQLGENMGQEYHEQFSDFQKRNKFLHSAMTVIQEYEETLSRHLIKGLINIPGITIHGISNTEDLKNRVPTISFTFQGHSPQEIAQKLAGENIFVWDGHYYAIEVIDSLGLTNKGGMLRIGIVHYNTVEELDKLLLILGKLSAS